MRITLFLCRNLWLFEIKGVPEDTAKEALRLASHKLPLKTKIITRPIEATTEAGGEQQ